MSNKVFIFIAGLLLGGAAGYFMSQKIHEEKYSQLAEEEIASVKAVFTTKNTTEPAPVRAVITSKNDKSSIDNMFLGETSTAAEEAKKALGKYTLVRDRHMTVEEYEAKTAQLKKDIANVNVETDNDEEEEVEEDTDDDEFDELESPYRISEEDYFKNDTQEKISLSYYIKDHILFNKDLGQIEEWDSLIGSDLPTKDDVDTQLYIRDKYLCVDYAISVWDMAYRELLEQENISGESPKERHRKNARRDTDA